VDKTLEVDTLRPGQKHRQVKVGVVAGGKGNNVARCVRTLGKPAASLLIVGGHSGRHVVDMLEHDDDVRTVPYWTEQPTRTITTVLETASGQQSAFFEPGPNLADDEVAEFLGLYEASLIGMEMVTLNGAVPCESLRGAYAHMIHLAKQHNIPTLLDSYGNEFAEAIEQGPWCVKINREEAADWLKLPVETEAQCLHALDNIQLHGVRLAIVTHGAEVLYAAWGNQRFRVTPPRVKEVNPVGSGDVFAGALCVATLENRMPIEALTFAAAAGAANAKCWDIGHFEVEQLEELQAQAMCQQV
jgi:tagatose 6-phosphate kinase